ncbi:interferon-induced protein 44-like [Talpa occidentalis]|uniref:interferon-induced protein 44-like n=1 Tax=Talpa occidentalis TaxID=50954 RepID=UPI001890A038|nr:interferon-induced protein 44-like [Talpa occidentalis]
MAVTTILSWDLEERLQILLGNVSLRLLYKSDVHQPAMKKILEKCAHQGSTLTIFYTEYCIWGALKLGHYPDNYGNNQEPNSSFIFLIDSPRVKISHDFLIGTPKVTKDSLNFHFSDVEILSVNTDKKTCSSCDLLSKKFGISHLYYAYYDVCEVFQVEGIKDDVRYISKITKIRRATQHRERLLKNLRDYKSYENLVSEVRILLLGPVGSGKSSFFNSVKSIFQGHMTRQAQVGSDITSITKQYRIYSVRDGKEGKSLPFTLCDTMGLADKEGEGMCMDDIAHILKGNMPDRYQFNPDKPITPKHLNYISTPELKDRIQCVAFVLDINSIHRLSSKMVENFKQIQKEALHWGIALVALLTKVYDCSEVLQDDLLNMNTSVTSQRQIKEVQKILNIPIFNILLVENYYSTWKEDPLKDILILSALRQMLRAADDALEDLPLEETEGKSGRQCNAGGKTWKSIFHSFLDETAYID